jgi:hypothetical protein
MDAAIFFKLKMKTMKNLLFAAFFCFICIALHSQTNDTAKLKQHIALLEQAHAQAIFKGNATSLDSLMDDDVTVNHPTGRIVKEKQELLDLINKGVIRYTFFERTPEQFLFFDDAVFVMGRETVTPAPGAPNAGKQIKRRYTNYWKFKNGRWQLLVRHANNVCE